MSFYELQSLFYEGDWEKTLAMIDSLNPPDKIRGLVWKIPILISRGHLQDAYELAKEVFQKNKEKNNRVATIWAFHWKVYSLLIMGNFSALREFEEEIDDLMKLCSDPKSSEVQEAIAQMHNIQAIRAMYTGNYDHGIEMGKKALALHEEANSPVGKAGSYYNISANYQFKEDVTLGLEYAQKGLAIASEHNFLAFLCMIYLTVLKDLYSS